MDNSKNDGVTININLDGNRNQEKVGILSPTSELISKERNLTKEELERQLDQGKLIDAGDGNGGTIYARLICRPQGGTQYYEDVKDGTKVKLIKKIASPYYIGTGKPE